MASRRFFDGAQIEIGSLAIRAGTTEAPSGPTNLIATAIDGDSISLTWDAFVGADAYQIERDGAVIVSDHPTNSYTDDGLTSATSYDYVVRAVI